MTRRHCGALAAGLLLVLASLLPPVLAAAAARLSTHMLLEMALLALIIPLLAYGCGPLLPDQVSSRLHPVAGIIALNLVIFAAQLPVVVDAGAANAWLREVVQVGVIGGAFAFWWPIVGKSGLSAIGKIGSLMVAGVPPTIPGLTMALSHHLFYQAYRSIEDEQLAGLVLFGTAKFALVGGTFLVLWRMLTPGTEPDDGDDREAPVEDVPPTAPAWLRRLDEELPVEPDRPRVPLALPR